MNSMKKAQYKRCEGKSSYVQGRYNEQMWICVSRKWIKWAKRYLNRAYRRKGKMNCNEEYN